MPSVKARLRMLSEYVDELRPKMTTFICEGGGEFRTSLTPEEYLYRFGAVTPDGRRIVRYPRPVENVDGLSLSLYELIDEAIRVGRLEYPVLESDPIS